ncbi:hypothetical protein ACQCPP_31745 (plasmid) [Priestia megaterium]|uniref:hypothetical protein n=1 Tax=Priestia megaterium TaxID=1404 RepID=UPI003CFF13A9
MEFKFMKKIRLSVFTTLTASVLLTSTAFGTPLNANAAENMELSKVEQEKRNISEDTLKHVLNQIPLSTHIKEELRENHISEYIKAELMRFRLRD